MSRAWCLILAVSVLACPGCDNNPNPEAAPPPAPGPGASTADEEDDGAVGEDTKTRASREDLEHARMIAHKTEAAEAREWLAAPEGHVLWKGEKPRIKKLVADLYEAGAPAVHAVNLSMLGDAQICAQFVVTLPAEPEARKRAFSVVDGYWTEVGAAEESVPDTGQKYLMVNLDL